MENDELAYKRAKSVVTDRKLGAINRSDDQKAPTFGEVPGLEDISVDLSMVSQEAHKKDEEGGLDDKEEENREMSPLYYFLASSFNVELVYIILKGITRFSKYEGGLMTECKKCLVQKKG